MDLIISSKEETKGLDKWDIFWLERTFYWDTTNNRLWLLAVCYLNQRSTDSYAVKFIFIFRYSIDTSRKPYLP